MTLTWYVEFDWDNDGTFETDEFSRVYGLKLERGRKHMMTKGSGFERQAVGRVTLALDNEDGRFDPFNSASAIYPNVKPGRECKIRVNDGVTTYAVFRGRIEDGHSIGVSYDKKFQLTVVDGWAQLKKNKINYPVQRNISTDTAIGYVLDKAGYIFTNGTTVNVWMFPTKIGVTSRFGPPGWTRNLGTGTDTIDYWWLFDGYAADAINDLTDSEFGLFWFAADGKASFLGRHGLYAQTSAATITQSQILRDPKLNQPWEMLRNVIRITAHPQVLQPTAVLWKLQSKPLIKAGESLTLYPSFSFSGRKVAAFSLTSPTAITDYTVNSASNGSGTDLTSGVTVAVNLLGETAELTITNNSGSDGYITLMQLRGLAIDSPDAALAERTDSNSRDTYGVAMLSMDLKWQDTPAVAVDFADWLKSWLSSPQPFPTIQIENLPSVQFARDLFDRITLPLTAMGINQDFRIGGIEMEWLSKNGQGVLTTWYLEPVVYSSNYWQFTTQIGITSRFAF